MGRGRRGDGAGCCGATRGVGGAVAGPQGQAAGALAEFRGAGDGVVAGAAVAGGFEVCAREGAGRLAGGAGRPGGTRDRPAADGAGAGGVRSDRGDRAADCGAGAWSPDVGDAGHSRGAGGVRRVVRCGGAAGGTADVCRSAAVAGDGPRRGGGALEPRLPARCADGPLAVRRVSGYEPPAVADPGAARRRGGAGSGGTAELVLRRRREAGDFHLARGRSAAVRACVVAVRRRRGEEGVERVVALGAGGDRVGEPGVRQLAGYARAVSGGVGDVG